jgi:DNA-binding HxlR family transcriptional regulator
MATTKPRTYGDSCGIARALDLAGERWALLIVRELLFGPKRFTDLRDGLPNLSPDVLAGRLRELEANGIVRRRKLPPPAAARVYELTEWGAELEPVLLALGRFGSRTPLPDRPPPLSPDALAVAWKTMFDPEAAGDLDRSYHVRLGEHDFAIRVASGQIEIRRGETVPGPEPALTIETDTATLTKLLWHGGSIDEAITDGTLTLRGPKRELARFIALFFRVRGPGPFVNKLGA